MRGFLRDDERLLAALLAAVDESVSLVGCHLCANDFEAEVIRQPIVRGFTSCGVQQFKSKLQHALCGVEVGSL
jgi:hypothetical protein